MTNPDVDVIGMLPGDLQQITTYSAGDRRRREGARGGTRSDRFSGIAGCHRAVYKTKGLAF